MVEMKIGKKEKRNCDFLKDLSFYSFEATYKE